MLVSQNHGMEKLKDKKILIAGATGGIGAATTKLLCSGGAKVAITGRNKSQLEELGALCHIPSDRIFEADLTQIDQVQQIALMLNNSDFGTPDIIINAAGIGIIKPMETLSIEDMLQSLQVNLMIPFHLLKTFLPAMKERKTGLIINIPGVLGKTPMAGAAAYSASKYGLNGMMKSIREELKRTDIRITQLFLGGVDSSFWDRIDLRVQRDKMIIAEEAGKAIWFLCQQPTSGVVSEMVIQPFNHQAI